jgi:hypothetical protein
MARFRWEGAAALTPGKHTIVFDFKYARPGPGKGGTGALSVDGKEVANQIVPHTIPFLMAIDETFDAGVDTRTSMDDSDYQVPFRFTGKLGRLTFELGPEQLMATDQTVKAAAAARVNSQRARSQTIAKRPPKEASASPWLGSNANRNGDGVAFCVCAASEI